MVGIDTDSKNIFAEIKGGNREYQLAAMSKTGDLVVCLDIEGNYARARKRKVKGSLEL